MLAVTPVMEGRSGPGQGVVQSLITDTGLLDPERPHQMRGSLTYCLLLCQDHCGGVPQSPYPEAGEPNFSPIPLPKSGLWALDIILIQVATQAENPRDGEARVLWCPGHVRGAALVHLSRRKPLASPPHWEDGIKRERGFGLTCWPHREQGQESPC
jgi:hypothetical protein